MKTKRGGGRERTEEVVQVVVTRWYLIDGVVVVFDVVGGI